MRISRRRLFWLWSCLASVAALLPVASQQDGDNVFPGIAQEDAWEDLDQVCKEHGFRTRSKEEGPLRVFDAFTFFREFDLLEIRLHELYPFVHKCVSQMHLLIQRLLECRTHPWMTDEQ